jgi:hypothetical protein
MSEHIFTLADGRKFSVSIKEYFPQVDTLATINHHQRDRDRDNNVAPDYGRGVIPNIPRRPAGLSLPNNNSNNALTPQRPQAPAGTPAAAATAAIEAAKNQRKQDYEQRKIDSHKEFTKNTGFDDVPSCECETTCFYRQCKDSTKPNYGKYMFQCGGGKGMNGCSTFIWSDDWVATLDQAYSDMQNVAYQKQIIKRQGHNF